MKFIAFYQDPKKKNLQRLEMLVVALILPLALVWGSRSYAEWNRFQQADQLYREGDALFHKGQTEQAIACLERCVAIYPEFYSAWEMLGATHHMRRDHAKEVATYQKAVAALPDNGLLHRELGTAYHMVGEHRKELESLTVAQRLLGQDEVFTLRLLDRAQREADGTYPAQVARAPRPETPSPQTTPGAVPGHEHHAGHHHEGHTQNEGHGHEGHGH
jgi:tetratricopeptide (TPR) repeat protein